MNTVNLYTIIAVAIYFLIIAYITYTSSKKETDNEYIIGNRKVGTLGVMSSQIVSNTDGTGITIMLMFGVIYGFGLLWMYFGIAIAALLLTWQARKIYNLTQKGNYVTISDMFEDRLGFKSAKASAILVIFLSVFATAAQLYIAGKLISAFFGIDSQTFGVVLTALIVTTYLMIGGYVTVIKTDVFQWLATFVLGIAVFIFGDFSVIAQMGADLSKSIDSDLAYGFLLWGLAWSCASPYTWQRIFSAKSVKAAQHGTWLTGPMNILFSASIVVFSLTIKSQNPEIDANNLVFEMYTNPNILPIIGPFLAVTVLSLLMSSLDTYGYMTTSTITTNLMKIDHETNKKKFVFTSRVITAIMFTSVTIMAIFIQDFIQYMLNTVSIALLLTPFYILVLFRKKKTKMLDNLSIVSFLIGLVVWIYMFVIGKLEGFLMMQVPMLVSMAINLIILIVFNLMFNKSPIDNVVEQEIAE
ncbi:MAG: hypothetical protein GY793_08820 [Proteobacteria bacterium]|nr:hypothetical protein [Pseudomonadota bacterium]